jgi:hypothetical protein
MRLTYVSNLHGKLTEMDGLASGPLMHTDPSSYHQRIMFLRLYSTVNNATASIFQ